MRFKTPAILALGLATTPALVLALDLTFLDQAPIRFMNDADIDLMEATVTEVLDQAADGETRNWSNDDTGHSGSVKAVKSFTEDDLDCRRVEITNLAAKATRGSASSMMDLCKIESDWRILRQRP